MRLFFIVNTAKWNITDNIMKNINFNNYKINIKKKVINKNT